MVLVFGAMKPDVFYVQRSISIKASPEKIFALIDDFHNWRSWAPQDREDPTMSRTYGGAPSGAGSVSEWNSAGSGGAGRMAIKESTPPGKVSIDVDFVKPFEAHNVNEFILEPAGESTKITWSMRGTNRYFMKVMSVFMSMDRMMGKHFEIGLNNLKILAESPH
jgi:uncharacterized protein YndB with AHSA1/START domain